jgi:hypothetical protein
MLKDDPKVAYIMLLTVDDPRLLSPRMQKEIQESFDKAETFADLSLFALSMYNRTRSMLKEGGVDV